MAVAVSPGHRYVATGGLRCDVAVRSTAPPPSPSSSSSSGYGDYEGRVLWQLNHEDGYISSIVFLDDANVGYSTGSGLIKIVEQKNVRKSSDMSSGIARGSREFKELLKIELEKAVRV